MTDKTKKILIWFMVIFLLPTFLLGSGMLNSIFTPPVQVQVRIDGREVDPSEWDDFKNRWQALSSPVMTQWNLNVSEWRDIWFQLMPSEASQLSRGTDGESETEQAARAEKLAPYTGSQFTNNMYVRYRMAKDQYGITVSQAEIDDYIVNHCLKPMFQMAETPPISYKDHCLSAGFYFDSGIDSHYQFLREFLIIQKMETMLEMVVQTDQSVVRDAFIEKNEERMVKYLELPASTFEREAKVEAPTENNLRDYYLLSGSLYNVPEKFRLEYVAVSQEQIRATLPEPTPEEIEAYYNSHQEQFGYIIKVETLAPVEETTEAPLEATPDDTPVEIEPKAPAYLAYTNLVADQQAEVKTRYQESRSDEIATERISKIHTAIVTGMAVDTEAIVGESMAGIESLAHAPLAVSGAANALESALTAAQSKRVNALIVAADAAALDAHETGLLSLDELAAGFPEMEGLDLVSALSGIVTEVGQVSDVLASNERDHLFVLRLLETSPSYRRPFNELLTDDDTLATLERDWRTVQREKQAEEFAYRKAESILKQMKEEGQSFEYLALHWREEAFGNDGDTDTEGGVAVTTAQIPVTGYFKREPGSTGSNSEDDPLVSIDAGQKELFRAMAFRLVEKQALLVGDYRTGSRTFYIVKLADNEPIRKPTFEQYLEGRAVLARTLREPYLQTFRTERYKELLALFEYEQAQNEDAKEPGPSDEEGLVSEEEVDAVDEK